MTLTVILNSGSTPQEKTELAETIAGAFQEAGREAQVVTIQDGDNAAQVCERWVKQAKESNGLLVAAGGDGTINLAANLCYRHQVTLGVIPMGTFNYFARELLIPVDITEAVKIIVSGTARKVAVGLVQDRVFLNNASFGLYTKLIRQREEASSRFGRIRLIAAFAAARSLLSRQRLFSVQIHTDEGKATHQTAMIFVGNNTLQLENLGMEVAKCTQRDRLAVVIMKPASRWEMARFLLRGAVGQLKDEAKLEEFCAEDFEATTAQKATDLVIDGEIIRCRTPLQFRVEKNALSVMVPVEQPNA